MMLELVIMIFVLCVDISYLSFKLFKKDKELAYYKYKQGLEEY